ncbi:unnamed protein product [Cuscuta europaea]|uniref:Uncharacterized protein n=1 Tax=Cuscuta europaea TaxID=41803 RepID=A0A9P0ZLX8_CUSEU|nr:unnamed protein product [Cuscuta europaea]
MCACIQPTSQGCQLSWKYSAIIYVCMHTTNFTVFLKISDSSEYLKSLLQSAYHLATSKELIVNFMDYENCLS